MKSKYPVSAEIGGHWRALFGGMLAALCLFAHGAGAQVPQPPAFVKSFSTPTVALTGTTKLIFTIANPNPGVDLTGVGFNDFLPSGLRVATPNGLVGNCGGGTIGAPSGTGIVGLTGATLTKAASCTFSVNVTGVQLGTQDNLTSVVTSVEAGNGGTAKASINVVPPPPPQVTAVKTFSPATINSGGTSILTIALSNNSVNDDANLLAFTDTFPGGMTLAPGPQNDTCSDGGLTVTANSITITSGFMGADGGTCTVSVPVTAEVVVTTTLTNFTSAFTCTNAAGTLCSGNPAGADLVVIGTGLSPTITSGAPPSGTVGVAYSFLLTATGTPTPDINASGLPPGLTQSGNQIIGTPTLAGTYAITIVASNGVSPSDTQRNTIVILDPLLIGVPGGGPTLDGGTVGLPYGPFTFTGSGGIPPYSWSACKQPVPPGLALSAGGTLSGTPTQAGTFNFDVCLKDSRGATTTQSVTVVVVRITTAMSLTVAPNPAASSYPVAVTAKVTGSSTAATGLVQFWVAGTGTKCPKPFVAGVPSDPDAAVRTAPLDANGTAKLTYANLRIDDYLVCAQYAGDGMYSPASAGAISLAVIKGLVLPAPAVTLAVPTRVSASATLAARIVVTGTDDMPVPQGSVSVRIADNEVASANLANGAAVLSIGMPAEGLLNLTADYAGDGLYPPASSDIAVVQVGDVPAAAPAGAGTELIPTLSQWTLGVLVLMLAMLGVRRLRRR